MFVRGKCVHILWMFKHPLVPLSFHPSSLSPPSPPLPLLPSSLAIPSLISLPLFPLSFSSPSPLLSSPLPLPSQPRGSSSTEFPGVVHTNKFTEGPRTSRYDNACCGLCVRVLLFADESKAADGCGFLCSFRWFDKIAARVRVVWCWVCDSVCMLATMLHWSARVTIQSLL